MFYLSTRDAAKAKHYGFEDAVMAGYADDGGVCDNLSYSVVHLQRTLCFLSYSSTSDFLRAHASRLIFPLWIDSSPNARPVACFSPGMLLPGEIPDVWDKLQAWSTLSYPDLCVEVLCLFAGDSIPRPDIQVEWHRRALIYES